LSEASDRTSLDAIFRSESGRLISVLTRILGPGHLELAEDVVQESFVAALRDWSANGTPKNSSAWLLTAARNRMIFMCCHPLLTVERVVLQKRRALRYFGGFLETRGPSTSDRRPGRSPENLSSPAP
jgi:predicted RNA polymerase sigma factor